LEFGPIPTMRDGSNTSFQLGYLALHEQQL
jgi:hypothetical protein